MPSTKYFCAHRKKIIIGAIRITDAAMRIDIFEPYAPFMDKKPRVAVKFFAPCRNVLEIRYSFHDCRPIKMLTVISPGDTTGRSTCQMTCAVLAPSILADSSSSFGTLTKNVRIRNTDRGMNMAARIRLVAGILPISPILA